MTIDEATIILGIFKIAYPNFYKDINREEAQRTAELWATMFELDDVKIVTEAVKALICTSKYPPTIADVKGKILEIQQPEVMTEMEAWNLVRNAISVYKAHENFEKLPGIIKKIVGSPATLKEWAMLEAETVETVIQSNFMRSFKVKQKQYEEYAKLPESTKKMIGNLSKKYALPENTDEEEGLSV